MFLAGCIFENIAESVPGVLNRKMKATFYLPGHPSYFDGQYSQEEVDAAIVTLKRFYLLHDVGEVPIEFVFLKEPGKSVAMKLDSSDPDFSVEAFREMTQDIIPRRVSFLNSLLRTQRDDNQRRHA